MVGKGVKKVVSAIKKNPKKAAGYAALAAFKPPAAAALGGYKAYQHFKKKKEKPKPERRPYNFAENHRGPIISKTKLPKELWHGKPVIKPKPSFDPQRPR